MVDDGRGTQVKIPTVLISLQDGQHIVDALREGSVVVSVTFEVQTRAKADLQLWLDISDHQNFVFLRRLQPFITLIRSHSICAAT